MKSLRIQQGQLLDSTVLRTKGLSSLALRCKVNKSIPFLSTESTLIGVIWSHFHQSNLKGDNDSMILFDSYWKPYIFRFWKFLRKTLEWSIPGWLRKSVSLLAFFWCKNTFHKLLFYTIKLFSSNEHSLCWFFRCLRFWMTKNPDRRDSFLLSDFNECPLKSIWSQ